MQYDKRKPFVKILSKASIPPFVKWNKVDALIVLFLYYSFKFLYLFKIYPFSSRLLFTCHLSFERSNLRQQFGSFVIGGNLFGKGVTLLHLNVAYALYYIFPSNIEC